MLRPANPRIRKGWLRSVVFLFAYILILGIFSVLGMLLLGLGPKDFARVQTFGETLFAQFISLLGTLLTLWLFMKFVNREPFGRLGLKFDGYGMDLVTGTMLGILIMLNAFFLLKYLGQIEYLGTTFEAKGMVISILLFAIVSIAEETVFRGYIQRNLMHSMDRYTALLVSALIFALAHGINPNISFLNMTNIFLAGILLGITYMFTQNLWFPIGLHFTWNLFQSLLGFNVSGHEFYSLVDFRMTQYTLLNGGAFGFEGSLLSTLILAVSIIALWATYRNKPAYGQIED